MAICSLKATVVLSTLGMGSPRYLYHCPPSLILLSLNLRLVWPQYKGNCSVQKLEKCLSGFLTALCQHFFLTFIAVVVWEISPKVRIIWNLGKVLIIVFKTKEYTFIFVVGCFLAQLISSLPLPHESFCGINLLSKFRTIIFGSCYCTKVLIFF